jgi:glutathione S-transferase
MNALLDSDTLDTVPFAPPFLKAGEQIVSQTASILQFLGPTLHLAPKDEAGRLWAHQLQLTVADFVTEIHDTHHPIGSGLYYEDQLAEAAWRSEDFIANRLPKFLGYFSRVLARNPHRGGFMVGSQLSYVDLSVFQLIEGLRYAFPKAMHREEPNHPGLSEIRERVAAHPPIARYLASARRIPFNTEGIFRHYPELDR